MLTTMVRASLLTGTSLFVIGCGPEQATPPELTAQQVAADYKLLEQVSVGDVYVDSGFSTLCVSPEPSPAVYYEVHGPHTGHYLTIRMNAPAREAFQSSTGYPVGSVVVKVKQLGEKERVDDGVGGMIKRAAGYDPDHGDWEYFYFETPTKIDSGKIESCVNCHKRAAATDYVFGYWSNQDDKEILGVFRSENEKAPPQR